MHRYLYAYGNPTVYIDLYGYESIGAGELSLYYEPGDMIPNKEKLNFTKKFAQTRPESLYSSDTDIEKEQLNELYNELSARGVNKENAFYRSFILVEDGSDEETSRQEALDFLGKGFLKKFTDDPLVREALIERFKGSKTGDLVDISDFWQDEIVAAEERGFKYAINHSRELNPLALPHEVNKGIAKDHLAPKALRDRASIDVWSQRAIALSPFLALGLEQKILGVSRTAFIQNGRQGASTSQRSGTLPISKLPFKAHQFNPTDIPDSNKWFSNLVKSIRKKGFENPKIDYVIINGEPYIVHGSNRFSAARILKKVDELEFNQVELPYLDYKNVDDVIEGASYYSPPKYKGPR